MNFQRSPQAGLTRISYHIVKVIISCCILLLFIGLRSWNGPQKINKDIYTEVLQFADSSDLPVTNNSTTSAKQTKQPQKALKKTATSDAAGVKKSKHLSSTPDVFVNDKQVLTTENNQSGTYKIFLNNNAASVFYTGSKLSAHTQVADPAVLRQIAFMPINKFTSIYFVTASDIDVNIDPDATANIPTTTSETEGEARARNGRDTIHRQLTLVGSRVRLGQSVYSNNFLDVTADSMFVDYVTFNNLRVNAGTIESRHCRSMHFNNAVLDSVSISGFVDSIRFTNITNTQDLFISTGNFCSLVNMRGSGQIHLRQLPELTKKIEIARKRVFAKYRSVHKLDTMLRTKVLLNGVDVTRLDFESHNFLFIVDTNQSFEKQVVIYNQLMNRFARIKSERQLYDIPFQKLIYKHDGSYVRDFFAEQWNNYGYEPNRIFVFALSVFIFLLCINIPLYPFMLRNGYDITYFTKVQDEIDFYPPAKRIIHEVGYCLLYTLLIFFVFRLELGKLRVSTFWLALWMVLQHAISLFLLASMASAIFK